MRCIRDTPYQSHNLTETGITTRGATDFPYSDRHIHDGQRMAKMALTGHGFTHLAHKRALGDILPCTCSPLVQD